MTCQRIFIPCLLFAIMLTLAIERPVSAAGQAVAMSTLWIRENGNDVLVTIENYIVPGLATFYGNGDDCGNTAHRTSKGTQGPRFFSHLHIHYNFPINGYVVNSNGVRVPKQVTLANVKAYWDNKFGIASNGGESPTYNCWGHTFGYSTWVQDPSYIYSDDYLSVQIPEVGCVIKQSGHALKVSEVSDSEYPSKVVTKTSEKNQHSGIYNKTYFLPGGGNFGNFHKKKP